MLYDCNALRGAETREGSPFTLGVVGVGFAFRVPGGSNIWRPPMSQTVIILSTSDHRSLYTLNNKTAPSFIKVYKPSL